MKKTIEEELEGIKGLMGPPVGYVDLLDHYTQKAIQDRKDNDPLKYFPLRPSSAGKCTRELFYELNQFMGKEKYVTEVMNPETHRLLNFGHSVEYHLIKQIEENLKIFDVKYKQQSLSFFELGGDKGKKRWVEGSMDLCLVNEKYKVAIDVKSKKDRFSSGHKSKWDEETEKLANMRSVQALSEKAFWVENLDAFLDELFDPFFRANFLQLNLYLNSEFLQQRAINHGVILQYNKNDSRLREIRFKPSRSLYEYTKKKFERVFHAVETNKMEEAEQEYVFGSMKCAFCHFSAYCHKDDALKGWLSGWTKTRDASPLSVFGKDTAFVEELFNEYEKHALLDLTRSALEEKIVKVMSEKEIGKVILPNGKKYELKMLKTPSPHLELRRAKE